MKKTEIAAVVLIAALVALASYFALDAIAGDPFKRTENVQYADAISERLEEPNPEVFNRKAINPTVEVTIGSDGQPVEPEPEPDQGEDTEEEAE